MALTGLTLVMSSLSADAIPARKNYKASTLADGSRKELSLAGDEYFSYYTDRDGNPYIKEGDTFRAITGANLARRRSERLESILTLASDTEDGRKKAPARLLGSKDFPTVGSPKVLVLLVEFADKKFSFNADVFERMMNERGFGDQGATGSVADYYRDNSMGAFTPEFDVFGPVTLTNNVAYYGSNDAYGNDVNPHQMVMEACRALDGQVDFRNYDADGDGVVDNVYIFYAGFGENDGGGSTTVWPHSSALSNRGATLTLDGTSINKYSCSNELQNGYGKTLTGIGTFCHEFTHVLGFPDLYATMAGGDAANWTPDCWTIMDQGSYNNDGKTPPCYTAYERSYLGWLTPVQIPQGTTALPSIADNYAFRVNTNRDDEYYLLEYRERKGWDANLPSSGMVVWHIDYDKNVWDANTVNNSPIHQRVSLVCADGKWADNERAGVPFPGSAKTTSLNTWPVFTAVAPTTAITGIREENSHAVFNVDGASALPVTPAIPAISNIRDIRFTLANGNAAPSVLVSVSESVNNQPLCNLYNLKYSGEEFTVLGLNPETEYKVTVRNVSETGAIGFPSPAATVMTAEPGISFILPAAPVAENKDGFVDLSWESIPGAVSYKINIYTEHEGGSIGETATFDNGAADVPEGWTTTLQTTFSVNGYYGEEKPSAVFEANGQYLQTRVFTNDIKGFSFWMRGRTITAGSQLLISGLIHGEWTALETIGELPTTASVYELPTDKLQGVRALRMEYSYISGSPRLMVDDVEVSFGNEAVKEYLYKDYEVGDKTEFRPTDLQPAQLYYATIKGNDGEDDSMESPATPFSTVGGSAIGNVSDDTAAILTAEGTIITASCDVNVYDISGRKVCELKAGESAEVLPGIYVAKGANASVLKIQIK